MYMSFYSISIGHHRFDIIRKFLNDQILLSLFSRRLKMSFSMLKPCRKILLSTIAQYFFTRYIRMIQNVGNEYASVVIEIICE